MAFHADTVWEIRADGAQANGAGFYDRDPGTSVDYSQQAAAQLTVADLATDGAGTGLSSATGGFTAAMAGNVVQISGGDLTAGWYEITVHTDTNNVTIDRSAGASKSGGTGNVGGAFDFGGSLDDNFVTAFVAGNICYIRGGNYSLGESTLSNVLGTSASPIRLIGYNTVRATRPTGTDRPSIDCGTFVFGIPANWSMENLIGTGTSSNGAFFNQTSDGIFLNCKATNTSGTSNYPAFFGTGTSRFIGCEADSVNGHGFLGGQAFQCYAHDSNIGFYRPTLVEASVADTCATYGVELNSDAAVSQTTIYNDGIGIYLSSVGPQFVILNCIFDACTTGFDAVSETDTALVAYCSFDNTTDFAVNVDECFQVGNRTGDPGLNDPANADFSITSADDVYQQGLDVEEWTGATVRS